MSIEIYKKNGFECEEFTLRSSHVNREKEMTIHALCEIIQELAYVDADKRLFGYKQLVDNQMFWVMSRIHVVFYRTPMWNEKLSAFTRIRSIDRIFSVRDFDFFDDENKCIAGAATLWTIIDSKNRRPQTIKDKIPILPQLYPEFKATDDKPSKILSKNNPEWQDEFTVKYGDVDIVGHVSNLRYIQWIADAFELSFFEKYSIKKFLVNFNAEAKYNQKLKIGVEKTSEHLQYIVHINRIDDDKNICKGKVTWEIK